MSHESIGESDDWFTPQYIFDAMGVRFDMDVAANRYANVPADIYLTKNALIAPWQGFVWMNPPFGKRNALLPWLEKFIAHSNGVALTPDRTSTPWWQWIAMRSDAILFLSPKVKFTRADGSVGRSPSNGTTLFALGTQGLTALVNANDANLGFLAINQRTIHEQV